MQVERVDLPARTLIARNIEVLRQGLALLGQIDDRLYVSISGTLFHSGVGSHFRHCLDSYQCFLKGARTGRIDYDQREREAQLDSDRARAMARIELTIAQLDDVLLTDLSNHLQSRQDSPHWTASSLDRELQFLLSHTIHHYALIALMLRIQGFSPAAGFGVAPSTLAYWQKEAELCVQ